MLWKVRRQSRRQLLLLVLVPLSIFFVFRSLGTGSKLDVDEAETHLTGFDADHHVEYFSHNELRAIVDNILSLDPSIFEKLPEEQREQIRLFAETVAPNADFREEANRILRSYEAVDTVATDARSAAENEEGTIADNSHGANNMHGAASDAEHVLAKRSVSAPTETSSVVASQATTTPVQGPVIPWAVINTPDGQRRVHFLLPATEVNPLLCKTMFSAAINDFPRHIQLDYKASNTGAAETRFRKILAIYEYLKSDLIGDNDLVIIMDAFDVWFQLPFMTLVQRYYELQKELPVESVIFGADKGCWPNPETSKACTNVPDSTLSKTVYGPNTDNDPYGFRMRPRWLNSGNIMGPAATVREIYSRAYDAQRHSDKHFSDQLLIADIFGQQDLPIALDYESRLFQTVTHSHADLVFLYQAQVEADEDYTKEVIDPDTKLSSKAGPKSNENPFDNKFKYDNKDLVNKVFLTPRPANSFRESEKLYCWNRVSANIPAVLHFNGPKVALDSWWGKMWWIHDLNSDHRWQRLKHVRRTGGAYFFDKNYNFTLKSFNEMCGGYNMFNYQESPFDKHALIPNERPGIGPEPFWLGMNPHSSPADVWGDLEKLREDIEKAKQRANKAKQKANKAKPTKRA
ncbi:hypothetical protein V1511DRAFT_506577 [Dipodascopsis uninucleata]